jgi:hypothetical protein
MVAALQQQGLLVGAAACGLCGLVAGWAAASSCSRAGGEGLGAAEPAAAVAVLLLAAGKVLLVGR